jgi:putative mRNA 3-end processing factor
MGPDADISTLPYGAPVRRSDAVISLHPAGHILGSAQVRIEVHGRVWVVSGDYKLELDVTCTPFEPVRCHTFVTESTFGLPIYRWPAQAEVFADIQAWWRTNQEAGKASLLFGYPLGKAQRLLAGVDPATGPIYTHGAVERMAQAYREGGIRLPGTTHVAAAPKGTEWSRALIIAPAFAHGSLWARKFGPTSTGLASGWMRIRGARRRRAVDRGFVLSDHVDWPALLQAIKETGAEQVWVTHGYTAVVVHWLREQGLDAHGVATPFEGERDDQPDDDAAETGADDRPAGIA